MRREEIEARIRSLATRASEQLGLMLVDSTYRKSSGAWRILVRIDRAAGVRIEDCANLSGLLSEWLDEADIIEHQYTLEVSSAGLSDPLRTDQDLQRFLERRVEIDLAPGQSPGGAPGPRGRKGRASGRTPAGDRIVARLVAYDQHHLTVDAGDGPRLISRSAIHRVRPAVDLKGTGVETRES